MKKKISSTDFNNFLKEVINGKLSSIPCLDDFDQEQKNKFMFLALSVLIARIEAAQGMYDGQKLQIDKINLRLSSIDRKIAELGKKGNDMIKHINKVVEAVNADALKPDALANYLYATGQVKVDFTELNKAWKSLVKGSVDKVEMDNTPIPEIVETFLKSLKFKSKGS